MDTSVIFYRTLREGDFKAFREAYHRALGGMRAPLIAVLPVPFYFVLGPGENAAMLTNLAFIAVFNVSLFALAQSRFGPWVALLATAITSTMTLLLNLAHQFLVEYGLSALVVLWLYLLEKSDFYRRWRYDILLGVILGLGLLMKVLFPLYITGPTLIVAFARLWRDGLRDLPWLLLQGAIVLALGAAVAGTWYVPNLKAALQFAISTSFGSIANNYSMGHVFDWRTIIAYWRHVVNQGFSPFYVLMLFLMGLAAGIRCLIHRCRPAIGLDGLVFGAWFVIPFAVATFGVNKDARFVAPAFGAVGICLAVLFLKFVRGRWLYVLLPLCMAWPLFNAIYLLIPAERLNWGLSYRGLVLLDDKRHQNPALAETPRTEKWPIEEMLAFIHEQARGERPNLMVAVDHYYLNVGTLNFYQRLRGYGLGLDQIAYRPKGESAEEVYRIVETDRFVLVKTGAQGPSFSNYRNRDIRARLQTSSRFRLLKTFPLPDGSVAEIYGR